MRGITLVLLAALTLAAASPDIRLDSTGTVRVIDAPPGAKLTLYVASGSDLPPVAGTSRVVNGELVFEPRFPLQPGLRYRAELKFPSGEQISRALEIPKRQTQPTTVVTQVYPTTDILPENLLKLYFHFSAPMSRGEAYRRIRLVEESGAPVELAFLELEQELWDSDGQRLTMLFDPGRIKQGLVPHKESGLALREGKSYTVVVDAGFLDANGVTLRQEHRKRFRVGPEDRDPPDPKTWKITEPKAGTREPMRVVFPEPMDRALLERVLDVATPAEQRIAGTVEIGERETEWNFTPDEPWKPARYILLARMILEDLAGNSIGKPFEVDVFEKIQERVSGATVRVSFTPVQ